MWWWQRKCFMVQLQFWPTPQIGLRDFDGKWSDFMVFCVKGLFFQVPPETELVPVAVICTFDARFCGSSHSRSLRFGFVWKCGTPKSHGFTFYIKWRTHCFVPSFSDKIKYHTATYCSLHIRWYRHIMIGHIPPHNFVLYIPFLFLTQKNDGEFILNF